MGDIYEEGGTENHRVLYTSISMLMKQKKDKIFSNGSDETKCSMKDKSKIAKLVGYKCILQFLTIPKYPSSWIRGLKLQLLKKNPCKKVLKCKNSFRGRSTWQQRVIKSVVGVISGYSIRRFDKFGSTAG